MNVMMTYIHTCSGANAICINEAGSYDCDCPAEYSLDVTIFPGSIISMGCSDADECALRSDNCDHDHGFRSNTNGGWKCECATGWEFAQTRLTALGVGVNDGKTCIDINECAVGSFECDPKATCVNDAGSYSCTCNEGFTGDGKTCIDYNECNKDRCPELS